MEKNAKKIITPDFVFEVSWEVCNKVGGIYTVLSTKAPEMVSRYRDDLIMIGPDVRKEPANQPEFIEDAALFADWHQEAAREGLNFRTGRWNIPESPVVILLDFTPLFASKDKIFAELWEQYELNSLTGQWDYIEPAMFGYGSGQLIESFYNYYGTPSDNIIAQFHEWMTGTGILYLKSKLPIAALVFTTHATVLGRTLAGNNLPLYGHIHDYDPTSLARRMNVQAKFSLEKTAAKHCDTLTTVSELTGEECLGFLGRNPDIITPNGFDDSFIPSDQDFTLQRTKARKSLTQLAQQVTGQPISTGAFHIITSGRYEYRNKGLDLFLNAIQTITADEYHGKGIVAWIMVPAHQTGPVSLTHPQKVPVTHILYDTVNDPVYQAIQQFASQKHPDIQIIFVPAYLDGADGILNINYYNLLPAFDLALFPSYYEPWGYTPLESMAFQIPSATTDLAGYGLWLKNHPIKNNGALIINRYNRTDQEVTQELKQWLLSMAQLPKADLKKARQEALNLSRTALWKTLSINYDHAYHHALTKAQSRHKLYTKTTPPATIRYSPIASNAPHWIQVTIRPSIPEELLPLQYLARNLWWTWNHKAARLFKHIDPVLWNESGHNPVLLLENISFIQIKKLQHNKQYVEDLKKTYQEFQAYIKTSTNKEVNSIAYFSMEYGLHDSIKTYSGGLGMLAGDHLREASDQNLNLVAIGLMYRYGYFTQNITTSGEQIHVYQPQPFIHLPIHPVLNAEGEWIEIEIALPGRSLYARIWRLDIGRIPLYLMDTDYDKNSEQDRAITHQLYGGDWPNRLKQELLLGVGGIRILKKLNITPSIYHINEGHAALISLERTRYLIQEQHLSFSQAREYTRATQLFTTHTPVPAGHDAFEEDLLRTYIPHYAERLNISWEQFMALGQNINPLPHEKFSLSILALNFSHHVNGVSKLHGRISREMFAHLYEGYFPEELHIKHITNGVHYATWSARETRELHSSLLNTTEALHHPEQWEKLLSLDDHDVWNMRNQLRAKLMQYLYIRLQKEFTRRQENPQYVLNTLEQLDHNTFTIVFARRFATYKRALLLFSNPNRLKKILNNHDMPARIIFAGKAHPADKAGQELIKQIINFSNDPEFTGKIIFVENYGMSLARHLISGADLWLNTPTRPLEASGTSGQKAAINGVVNLSVLDGWWAEGYKPAAGWALPEQKTYDSQQYQNSLDAERLYTLLENEIIPMFYNRTEGIPLQWISHVKQTMASVAPFFTTTRMLDDYTRTFYSPMLNNASKLRENHYQKIKEYALWKEEIIKSWDSILVLSIEVPDTKQRSLILGEKYHTKIMLNIPPAISPDNIGIEVLIVKRDPHTKTQIIHKEQLHITERENGVITYEASMPAFRAGVFDFAFRMFPCHDLMPHRQDFPLIKWL